MKFAHNYFVYIVQCRDCFYYTGITNDLERSLYEHNEGLVSSCFTFKRRPVVLKYFEHYTNVTQAIQRETQVKGWSRAKKEALFVQDFDLLKELANCTQEKWKEVDGEGPRTTLRQAQGDSE
jgi:putative endonuclease